MNTHDATQRPDYIGADWFRCTRGMAFASRPPDSASSTQSLASPNMWVRLACTTLRAQQGDFSHSELLLDIITQSPDDHLRDCAVRLFSLTAPAAALNALAAVFEHANYDTRIEAYRATALTGDLALAVALSHRHAKVRPDEREFIMDNISDILDSDIGDLELAESPLDSASYERRVHEKALELQQTALPTTYYLKGKPLSVRALVALIKQYIEEDPTGLGGSMANLCCLLEAMTGTPYAGCFDDECNPVMHRLSHMLNKIQQSRVAERLEAGRRYFFGHRVP